MNELVRLHESVVVAEEIDTLGHLNVRYYIERMNHASTALLEQLGVVPNSSQVIRRTETYTRFMREQFEGATLQTFGGLVNEPCLVDAEGVSAFFEIRNRDTGDVAACFIVTSNLVDAETQESVKIDVPTDAQMNTWGIVVPEHGRPRTLSLVRPKPVPFDALAAYISEHEIPGAMYGRREGVVQQVDCDRHGRLREEIDLMFVMYRPEHEEAPDTQGPPVFRDEQGRRYSWAVMENRSVVLQRPMLGDELVSLSGDLSFGEKWRQTRRWIFNRKTKAFLGVSDHVALCMDLDARKSIPIPADERALIEANCLTQFT